MLGILQQNKELSSHTLHQRSEKKTKKCPKLESFQTLTYINFRQTNAFNMIFYISFLLGILKQTKESSCQTNHQIPEF